MVYVPTYNPTTVYGAPVAAPPGYTGYSGTEMLAAGVVGFGAGMLLGSLINSGNNNWGTNWYGGNVVYNRNVWVSNSNFVAGRYGYGYGGYRPGYPGYRPGYPGYRPGYPGYRPGLSGLWTRRLSRAIRAMPAAVRVIPARCRRIGPAWPEQSEHQTAELSQARHASQPARDYATAPGRQSRW